jgi:hypothetical protein
MDKREQWQEHTRRDHAPANEALRTECELQALYGSSSEQLELSSGYRRLREDVDLLIDIVLQLPEHHQLQQRYQQLQLRRSGRGVHDMGRGRTQAMLVGPITSGMMKIASVAAAGASMQPRHQTYPDQQPHVSVGVAQGNGQVSTKLVHVNGGVKGQTNDLSSSMQRAPPDPPGPAKRAYPLVLQLINQQRKVDALTKKEDTGQLEVEQAKLRQLQLLHATTTTNRHRSNQDDINTLITTTSAAADIANAGCKRKRVQGQSSKLADKSETPALSNTEQTSATTDGGGAIGMSGQASGRAEDNTVHVRKETNSFSHGGSDHSTENGLHMETDLDPTGTSERHSRRAVQSKQVPVADYNYTRGQIQAMEKQHSTAFQHIFPSASVSPDITEPEQPVGNSLCEALLMLAAQLDTSSEQPQSIEESIKVGTGNA